MFKRIGLTLLLIFLIAGASAALLERPVQSVVDPIHNTLFVPHNIADNASEILVFSRVFNGDGWQEQPTRRIPLSGTYGAPVYGLAVNQAGNKLFAATSRGNYSRLYVYELDEEGLPSGNFYPVGFPALYQSYTYCRGVALVGDPDTPRVYVVNEGATRIDAFDYDTNTGKYVHNAAQTITALAGEDNLWGIAIGKPDANGHYKIFVTQNSRPGVVYVLDHQGTPPTSYEEFTSDPQTNSALQNPTFVKVSPNGSRLYVANNSIQKKDGDVRVYAISSNTPTLTLLARVSWGSSEQEMGRSYAFGWSGMDLSVDGNVVYFTQRVDDPEDSDPHTQKIYWIDTRNISGKALYDPATNPVVEEATFIQYQSINGVVVSPDNLNVVVSDSMTGFKKGHEVTDGRYNFPGPTLRPPPSPVFISIDPSVVNYGEQAAVTVTGENFMAQTETYIVIDSLHDFTLDNKQVKSPTEMTGNIPAAVAIGTYDIRVLTTYVNGVTKSDLGQDALTVTTEDLPPVDPSNLRQFQFVGVNPGGWAAIPFGGAITEWNDIRFMFFTDHPEARPDNPIRLEGIVKLIDLTDGSERIIDPLDWEGTANCVGVPVEILIATGGLVEDHSYDWEVMIQEYNNPVGNYQSNWVPFNPGSPDFVVNLTNRAPNAFGKTRPTDGSDECCDVSLQWQNNGDPDPSDTLTYDVAVYHQSDLVNPVHTASGITTNMHNIPLGTLTEGERYLWNVSASDGVALPVWANGAEDARWSFNYIQGIIDPVNPPEITQTSPANADTNVAVSAPIEITFSESMQGASVINALTVEPVNPADPPVTGLNYSWNASHTVLTITHNNLATDTEYRVEVDKAVALDLDSPPKNLIDGAVPNPFTFTTGTGGVNPEINLPYDATRGNLFWISVPYNTPYITASDIIADINQQNGEAADSGALITSIGRWDGSTDPQEYNTYDYLDLGPPFGGSWSGNDFNIIPGEALYLNIAADATFTLQGSHDPSFAFNMTYVAGRGNLFWMSLPYSGDYTDAVSIIADINTSAGLPADSGDLVTSIGRWDGSANPQEYNTYDYLDLGPPFGGSWSGNNFTFTPGEGYYINLKADVNNWQPQVK